MQIQSCAKQFSNTKKMNEICNKYSEAKKMHIHFQFVLKRLQNQVRKYFRSYFAEPNYFEEFVLISTLICLSSIVNMKQDDSNDLTNLSKEKKNRTRRKKC